MVDRELHVDSILKIWGQTWIINCLITMIMFMIGEAVTFKDWTYVIAPFIRRTFWYSSAYIGLLMLAPFLNRISRLNRQSFKSLLAVLTFLIVFFCSISKMMDDWIVFLVWFSYVYLCVLYYKRYLDLNLNNKWFLPLGISLYIICITLKYWFYNWNTNLGNMGYKMISQYLIDYKSFLNFAIAIMIFLGTINYEHFYNKCINSIAKSAYGVYLFHQVPCFYMFLWLKVYKLNRFSSISDGWLIVYLVFVICSVYCSGTILDYLRRRLLEPLWVNSKCFAYLKSRYIQFIKSCV